MTATQWRAHAVNRRCVVHKRDHRRAVLVDWPAGPNCTVCLGYENVCGCSLPRFERWPKFDVETDTEHARRVAQGVL